MKELLDGLTTAVADRVIEDLRKRTEWVHQRDSVLGPRTHIRAARERAERNEDGVVIRGRDYYLTPAAIEEESRRRFLARCTRPVEPERQSGVFSAPELDEWRNSLRRKLRAG